MCQHLVSLIEQFQRPPQDRAEKMCLLKETSIKLETHSFGHDERQQVVEERGKFVCRHSRGHQWDSLPSKLQKHGIIFRLDNARELRKIKHNDSMCEMNGTI